MEARARAHQLAVAHGWNATAFQTLAQGFSYSFHDQGYVAYVDTGSAWIAAGAPVCREDALGDIVRAFVAEARAAGRRCCFFGVEARLIDAAEGVLDTIQIGEQPVWDPQKWLATLKQRSGLREQLRRARAKGVTVREATAEEREKLTEPVQAVIERWLATRAMPPMGFVVAVPTSLESVGARRFVAFREGHIVGMACLLPVPARNGFFVEHLLRDPSAPNGTVELMVDAIMRWVAASGGTWLTLGLAPLAGELSAPLRFARRRLRWLYDFEGLRKFKAKFRPCEWVPIHLAFPRSQGAFESTFDVLSAFAPGGILRFGARFVSRGHPALLATLAVLLIPWTALLASASASQWFAGHAAIKWAWVAFDSAVIVGLLRLLRRPSWKLAALLAAAVSVDAFLTPIEAVFWNLHHVKGWFDGLVLGLACAAPALAAIALWGATKRLKRCA